MLGPCAAHLELPIRGLDYRSGVRPDRVTSSPARGERYGGAAGSHRLDHIVVRPLLSCQDTRSPQSAATREEDAAVTLFDPNSYGDLSALSRARQDYLTARRSLDALAADAPAGSPAAFLAQRLGWNIDFAVAETETSYYDVTVTLRRRMRPDSAPSS